MERTDAKGAASRAVAAMRKLRGAFYYAFNAEDLNRLSRVVWWVFDLALVAFVLAGPLIFFAFRYSVEHRWLEAFNRRQPMFYNRFWHLIVPHTIGSILAIGRAVTLHQNLMIEIRRWQRHPVPRPSGVRFVFHKLGRAITRLRPVMAFLVFFCLSYSIFYGLNPQVLGYLSAWLDTSPAETMELTDPRRHKIYPEGPDGFRVIALAPAAHPDDWFLYYPDRGVNPRGNVIQYLPVDERDESRLEIRWHRGALGIPWVERDSLTVSRNMYYAEYGPTDQVRWRPLAELKGKALMLIYWDACVAAYHPKHYLDVREKARRNNALPLLFSLSERWRTEDCADMVEVPPKDIAGFDVSFNHQTATDLIAGLKPVRPGGYVLLAPQGSNGQNIPWRDGLRMDVLVKVIEQANPDFPPPSRRQAKPKAAKVEEDLENLLPFR